MRLLAALAAVAVVFPGAEGACRSDGDWANNAYLHLSTSVKTQGGSNAVELKSTANTPAWYKENVQLGLDSAAAFLSTVSGVTLFLTHAGGADSEYDAIKAEYCTWAMARGDWITSCEDQMITGFVDQAKNGDSYFASPYPTCACDDTWASDITGIFLHPGAGDLSNGQQDYKPGFSFAVHEYTHAWQDFSGGIAGWMREGGAVYMECLMGVRQNTDTWTSCLQNGGGGGGILTNVARLYATDSTTSWLKQYGEWRSGSSAALDAMNGDYSRWVYYDAGALAIAFAVSKARAMDNTKTSRDWYVGDGGFHMSVLACDDLETVSDTEGWKKALLDFTGYSSTDAFYADFDAFARLSQSDQLAALETQAQVEAFVALDFSTSVADCTFPKTTHLACAGGCGGSPSPPPPSPPPAEDDDDDVNENSGSKAVLAAAVLGSAAALALLV